MAIPGRWGLKEDEDFVIPSSSLTGDFADNVRLANVRQTDHFAIYVDYTKGSEAQLEIKIEYSILDDLDPNNEEFFQESIVSNMTGIVEPFIHIFQASERYRIVVPTSMREDRIRVSVRGDVAGTGSVRLYFSTNNPRFKNKVGYRTG